ncbi:MAG: HD domain-containing protein [Candidatus Diapherotrites archaeon]|nr:HD domain-containing protein [Candidatus Diapherotrites archaeon]
MNQKEFIEKLRYELKKSAATLATGHDIEHLQRVLKNGLLIAKKLRGIDKEILIASLLLHDADRSDEKRHAEKSAELAEKILSTMKIPKEKISIVKEAILHHSRSDVKSGNKSIYAQILYDADKIDGIGNEGIKRVEEIAKAKNWTKEYAAKWYLSRIIDVAKNEPLYLKHSKEIAKNKVMISLNWCKKILGKERFEKIIRESEFSSEKEVSECF